MTPPQSVPDSSTAAITLQNGSSHSPSTNTTSSKEINLQPRSAPGLATSASKISDHTKPSTSTRAASITQNHLGLGSAANSDAGFPDTSSAENITYHDAAGAKSSTPSTKRDLNPSNDFDFIFRAKGNSVCFPPGVSTTTNRQPLGSPTTDFHKRFTLSESAVKLPPSSIQANGKGLAPAWDFILPTLPPPAALIQPGNYSEALDLTDLVGAIQNGANIHDVQTYMGYYDEKALRRNVNGVVEGFPVMFYVVATNNEPLIRAWVNYGGDINVIHKDSGIPLLAFAIMHSETIETDTTLTVATLLSLGADPHVIPSAFYTPFYRDLPDDDPAAEDLTDIKDANKTWCTVSAQKKLARTANLSQRYYLEKATKVKKPSIRQRQIAKLRKAEALLGIPYFLIGQKVAANILLKKLLSYLLLPSKRPLVLVFAGPSGHGKTELARRLGRLLSLELEVVDCTTFTSDSELFGPRTPFVGWDKGSPLNNFLARKNGEKCIVFLDEFEKTTKEVHQTLLLPFDNGEIDAWISRGYMLKILGEFQDRRCRSQVDCSKTIWILATNALDERIKSFCNQNATFVEEEQPENSPLTKNLWKELREEFLQKFGVSFSDSILPFHFDSADVNLQFPLTGRISSFVPFLLFSVPEQAVLVHKYLLELGQKVHTPVNLSSGPNEQLLGNIQLHVRRDASVCRTLAEVEYHQDLGARSLITAVKSIEDLLVESYLDQDEEVMEGDEMLDFVVDVNAGDVIVSKARG